jgi:hypothetical protein
MVKKRSRFKQTTSLEQRLTKFSRALQDQVKTLPTGSQQADLSRKIQQTDAALRINALLNSHEAHTLADSSSN